MKWGYRPICDRITPNATLSAGMRKEDEISQKKNQKTVHQIKN